MQHQATCPSCQQRMFLLAPKPLKEADLPFWSVSDEVSPLFPNGLPRWLVRCPAPGCQRDAVTVFSFPLRGPGEHFFGLCDYQKYRAQRHSDLTQLGGKHLGEVMSAAFFPAWLSTFVTSIIWSAALRSPTMLLALTGFGVLLVIAACMAVFALASLLKREEIEQRLEGLFQDFYAVCFSFAWIILVASTATRTELFVAVGILVFYWVALGWGIQTRAKSEAEIAVEQEALTLRWLKACAQDPTTLPYREAAQ